MCSSDLDWLKPVTQDRDQGQIGGRHRVIAQVVWADPGQILTFGPGGNSLPFAASKKRHQEVKIRIAVTGEGQRRETAGEGVDGKFFFKLSDQGRFWCLAGFNLATGKFPKACKGFAFWALGQKNPAVWVYQGYGGDEDDFHI